MVSTYAYPTFTLSNAVLLLAKLLLEGESWSHVQKSPLTLPKLALASDQGVSLDWTGYSYIMHTMSGLAS